MYRWSEGKVSSMLNLTTTWKLMVTHAPIPLSVGKNLWDLLDGRLDRICIWFGHGCWWENSCPCLITQSIATQFTSWAVMAHVGDAALLNKLSSRIEQLHGYFLILCVWFSSMTELILLCLAVCRLHLTMSWRMISKWKWPAPTYRSTLKNTLCQNIQAELLSRETCHLS